MVWVRFVIIVYLVSLGLRGIGEFEVADSSKLHHILDHLGYTEVVCFRNI